MTKKNDKAKGAVVQDTPTPGLPLSGEDVALLKRGDVLRCINPHTIAHKQGQHYVFSGRTHNPPGAGNDILLEGDRLSTWSGIFTFIGRPDADGWIAWSGGENPVPGVKVDWSEREEGPQRATLSDDLRWSNGGHACDIIAFRLPTAKPAPEAHLTAAERAYGEDVAADLVTTPPSAGPDAGLGRDVLEIAVATVRWALARGDDLRDYKEPLEVILSAADPLPAAAALEAAAERELRIVTELDAACDRIGERQTKFDRAEARAADMRKALEEIAANSAAKGWTRDYARKALQQADSAPEAEGVR